MNDTQVNEVLNRLLFEHKLKITSLARQIDVPQPTLHRIASGQSKNPHMSTMKAIADHFKVSIAQLRGDLPLHMTTSLPRGWKMLPVVDWETAAQWPQEITPQHERTYTNASVGDNAFSIIATDSSMEPMFPKGTHLIIDPDRAIEDRSFVAVKLANYPQAIFRQLLLNLDKRYIKPMNTDLEQFEPIPLGDDDKLIGVVVEAKREF